MVGDRSLASIDMLELTVLSLLANQIEPEIPKDAHRLVGLENGNAAHSILQTATVWVPTNSASN